MNIVLRPLGDIEPSILDFLRESLAGAFGGSATVEPAGDIRYAYEPSRAQYLAPAVLEAIKKTVRGRQAKTLGVADVDLYAPGLSFVFGQADPAGGVAAISLTRLRQEFYGLPEDNRMFRERILKEAVHELGHTLGLAHCDNPRCIMHFSNSLADTDYKQAAFCPKCRPRLAL